MVVGVVVSTHVHGFPCLLRFSHSPSIRIIQIIGFRHSRLVFVCFLNQAMPSIDPVACRSTVSTRNVVNFLTENRHHLSPCCCGVSGATLVTPGIALHRAARTAWKPTRGSQRSSWVLHPELFNCTLDAFVRDRFPVCARRQRGNSNANSRLQAPSPRGLAQTT